MNLLSEDADVPGGYREWLGPYADRLGRDLELVVGADPDEARAALTTAFARLGLTATADTEDPDLLRIEGGDIANEISLGHFARAAGLLVVTIAEAAADAARIKQIESEAVARVLPLVENIVTPLEVEARSIYDVIVRGDKGEISIDLVGLLDEVRGDVLSGEFERLLGERCRKLGLERADSGSDVPTRPVIGSRRRGGQPLGRSESASFARRVHQRGGRSA